MRSFQDRVGKQENLVQVTVSMRSYLGQGNVKHEDSAVKHSETRSHGEYGRLSRSGQQ